MIRTLIFPRQSYPKSFSLFLLAMRILFGGLLMMHGIQKLSDYTALSAVFPDPMGIGSPWSLSLAVFGELFCSAAFIAGFLYRLSMLPMLATMAVAFFAVHGGNIAEGELAFIYLAVFLLMYIAGPGRYSIDHLIAARTGHKEAK